MYIKGRGMRWTFIMSSETIQGLPKLIHSINSIQVFNSYQTPKTRTDLNFDLSYMLGMVLGQEPALHWVWTAWFD